jgi:hypothetical protein
VPLIMLSNATYTSYDPDRAAGWSEAISVGLLRQTLGFRGISITDSLTGIAAARGVSPTALAIRAAQAGTDMILVSGTESTTRATYAGLLSAARAGRIARDRLVTSYNRILATKARITPPLDDTTAPTVEAPQTGLLAGGQLGFVAAPVRTTWSATDPCHIARFVLQRQRNGGGWTGQGPADGTDTSVDRAVPVGSTIRYRLRATDGAGNASGFIQGRPFRIHAAQESGAAVAYAGQWQTTASTDAAGGGVAFSRVAGASATFTFSGYAVSWVAARGPHRGSAAVYLDGQFARRINLHAATPQSRSIAFAKRWADNGMHSIAIVNLGTAGHPRVDVDAFVRLVFT